MLSSVIYYIYICIEKERLIMLAVSRATGENSQRASLGVRIVNKKKNAGFSCDGVKGW